MPDIIVNYAVRNRPAGCYTADMQTDNARERAVTALAENKAVIDRDIAGYIVRTHNELAKLYNSDTAQIADSFFQILARGGKRIRGVLAIESYRLFGGKDDALAVSIARILEMLHAYLLVVDDVADQSELRRGGPAAHKLLQARHKAAAWAGDEAHFGRSQAINAGLVGQNLAFREIMNLPVKDALRQEIFTLVNDQLITTGFGQMADIMNEAVRSHDETAIRQTLQWKTAYYTFLLPLRAGALLAGARTEYTDFLVEYAIQLGTAFQVADDITGIFGNPAQSGKSNKDDITEGKRTLLVAYAYRHANPADRRALDAALGNKRLTALQYRQFCSAIEDSGAYTYARQVVKETAKKAVASLRGSSQFNESDLEFLKGLAELMGEI